MVLTTSFSLGVLTNEQKWINVIDEIKNGNPPILGEVFPMTLTDGTEIEMIAVDVAVNGDVTFGASKPTAYMEFLKDATAYTVPVAWSISTVRDYCGTTFYSLIPDSIKNEIKSKTQNYAKINGATSGNDSGMFEIESVTDKIWIPAFNQIYADTYPNVQYAGKAQVAGPVIKLYTTGDTEADRTRNRKNLGYLNEYGSLTATVGGKQASSVANVLINGASANGGAIPATAARVNVSNGVVPHFIIGSV